MANFCRTDLVIPTDDSRSSMTGPRCILYTLTMACKTKRHIDSFVPNSRYSYLIMNTQLIILSYLIISYYKNTAGCNLNIRHNLRWLSNSSRDLRTNAG